MSEPSVDEIVAQLAGTYIDDTWLAVRVDALIADWRKRGEALATARAKGVADERKRIEDVVCSVRYIDLGTMFVIDPAEVLVAIGSGTERRVALTPQQPPAKP